MADNPQGMNPQEQAAYGLFWGQIEAAANAKMTTADMWDAIRAQATELGMSGPGVSAAAVMRLRGYASSIVRAGETFDATNPEYAIDSSMISSAPWSRDVQTQSLAPIWQVRYQASGTDAEGNPTDAWLTAVFTGNLPDTVGEMQDAILGGAQDTVDTSEGGYMNLAEVGSVSNIQIMAV